MDTFILHIKRESGFVAAVATTKIIIDGINKCGMKAGSSQDFTLPRKPVEVVLLNSVSFGKDIKETVVIDPRDSIEVTLIFRYRFNAKSLLSFGSITKQTCFIETEVIHGPSVSSASTSASYTAERTASASTTPGDTKFCTECGTPNPKSAKFCQGCGNKF